WDDRRRALDSLQQGRRGRSRLPARRPRPAPRRRGPGMADLRAAARGGRRPSLRGRRAPRALPDGRRCGRVRRRPREAGDRLLSGAGHGVGDPDRGHPAGGRQGRRLPAAPRAAAIGGRRLPPAPRGGGRRQGDETRREGEAAGREGGAAAGLEGSTEAPRGADEGPPAMEAGGRTGLAAAALAALGVTAARPCPTVEVIAPDRPVVAYNYDFHPSEGLLLVNKRGTVRRSRLESGGARWTSRFGSVTFNQFGRDNPTTGMNESGLMVSLMWLDGSRYPDADDRPAVGILEWIQYNLDGRASVAEVVAGLDDVRPASETPIHFYVADATGDAAVIEFLQGKAVV